MSAQASSSARNVIPVGFLDDLAAAISEEEILRTCARWSRRIIHADRTEIALLRPDGAAQLKLMRAAGRITNGPRIDLSRSLLGKTVRTQAIQTLDDLAGSDQPRLRELAEHGFRSMLQVPILAAGQCFGAVIASFRAPGCGDRQNDPALLAMANWMGLRLMALRQLDHLHRLTHTDPLTGAFNRRALATNRGMLWQDWTEHALPFSIIMVDLDHFKQVNDRHGHDAGDQVLQSVVDRVQTTIRSTDLLVRLGGEEFCAILPRMDTDAAMGLSERLRTLIRTDPVNTGHTSIPITASFGVATVCPHDAQIEDVLSRADQALYQAKVAGRNTVRLAATLEMAG